MLSEESKKRILILTADVGFGHRSAANAVSAALLERYSECCQADFIINKAGGLIVSEALACGLPFLFVDVTPGQEEGNADYVIRNKAGELATTPVRALEILCHCTEGGKEELRHYAEASRNLGRPFAAYDIAELTWQAAERGRINRSLMNTQAIARLREALNNFGISWESE